MARALEVAVGDQKILTPNCFLYSKAGYPPSITDDLLEELQSNPVLVHISLSDFYDQLPVVKSHFDGIFQFVGLTDKDGQWKQNTKTLFLLSCMDLLSVSLLPSTEDELSMDTQSGRKKITPEEYVNILEILKPSLAIQPFPEVSGYSQKKRIGKSVKHSTAFARKCLEMIVKQSTNTDQAQFCKLWTVVTGGSDMKSWEISLNDFNQTYTNYQEQIGGVLLACFGQGETSQQRDEAIQLWDPIDVLNAVSNGIDLFTSVYPHVVAENGTAFCFRLRKDSQEANLGSLLNLRDNNYQKDWKPLIGDMVVEGESSSDATPSNVYRCPCYCCRRHTRAYLHHLFNTHELLGCVLLNIHNTYHYLQFFKIIREQIEANTFSEYKSWFIEQWNRV